MHMQILDDVLIHIFCCLPVESILNLRQTCKHLATISRIRFIWQTACINQVLAEGYPFPDRLLPSASSLELEQLVIRARRLGAFWLSSPPTSPVLSSPSVDFQATTGTGVSDVRFLPQHTGRYLLTVYQGIWTMISCWDVASDKSSSLRPRKLADWCPKNVILAGFVVNSDPHSNGMLAVAVQHARHPQSIEILTIVDLQGPTPRFQSICNIATTFRPITLKGDLIAFSDDASQTVVMNWRENTFALLKGSQEPLDGRYQYNHCLQVVFAYHSILVVRARSLELFPYPPLHPPSTPYTPTSPLGEHSFGWIDGVSVRPQSSPRTTHTSAPAHDPLSIVLRPESDDPWASDVHNLAQFVLRPNPAFAPPAHDGSPSHTPNAALAAGPADPTTTAVPYLFPPVRVAHTSPTTRGVLRCREIALGPRGTALWVQPPRRVARLATLDVPAAVPNGGGEQPAREALCAAVFAGPLGGGSMSEEGGGGERMCDARTLWVQTREGSSWTAMDYVEETGRVVLGASDGRVTVLDVV